MKKIIAVCVLSLLSSVSLLSQSTPTPVSDQTQWVTLKVKGMTCAGCANHIQKALSGKEGVEDHEVKYPGDLVRVKYDPEKIKLEDVQKAIADLGYKVEPVDTRKQ